MQIADYVISGPFTHENLSVFLLHGRDHPNGHDFLTLQEAMERKVVMVHETSNVNELAIENLSEAEVYVQSGEIVKGGRQDRVLTYDLIVPAHSGRLPIAAFCVERGRWNRRGAESASEFSSSTGTLNTKSLKLAARRSQSQHEVWASVAEAQDKLTGSLGAPVAAAESASSLQLTLENERVKATAQEYLDQLAPVIEGQPDVAGYAFAINGQINSADLYASTALFRKLWAKLLNATAVEALAELDKHKLFKAVTAEEVRAALAEAERGAAAEKDVTGRIRLVTRETGRFVFFETRDLLRDGAWIHRNYVSK